MKAMALTLSMHAPRSFLCTNVATIYGRAGDAVGVSPCERRWQCQRGSFGSHGVELRVNSVTSSTHRRRPAHSVRQSCCARTASLSILRSLIWTNARLAYRERQRSKFHTD